MGYQSCIVDCYQKHTQHSVLVHGAAGKSEIYTSCVPEAFFIDIAGCAFIFVLSRLLFNNTWKESMKRNKGCTDSCESVFAVLRA